MVVPGRFPGKFAQKNQLVIQNVDLHAVFFFPVAHTSQRVADFSRVLRQVRDQSRGLEALEQLSRRCVRIYRNRKLQLRQSFFADILTEVEAEGLCRPTNRVDQRFRHGVHRRRTALGAVSLG